MKQAVQGFVAHGALSRGAAIAFYVVTSLAPVLLIVVAIAGLAFGDDAVRGNLMRELSGVFGQQGGELVENLLARSSDKPTGAAASAFGVLMILVTASGVFGEMQTALNRIWEVEAFDLPVASMIRARAVSLGLVAALGFLLIASLVASTGLAALGTYVGGHTTLAPLLLSGLNTLISLVLFAILFAAIFKVLPDTVIPWRDVITGGLITALLFTIGKSLIGWYLGTTATSSTYGAAHSAQIFLFGAEITRAVSKSAP